MREAFEALFARGREGFRDRRVYERALVLSQAMAVSFSRRTVSATLTACGRQFEDWSAAYRIFERERFEPAALFSVPRRAVVSELRAGEPLVVVIDDTLIPKWGRKVADAKWQHDPHSPPFQHQIAWGQRAIQVSAILPPGNCAGQAARAIPIDLELHCLPKAPRKPTREQRLAHQAQCRANSVPVVGATRIAALREALDRDDQQQRPLVVAFDGGYTNKTLFRAVPQRTALVGRLRKDAKLFAPPKQSTTTGRGRKRVYGDPLPTPEQLLKDPSAQWRQTTVFAAGKTRTFEYKTIERCRWRGAGDKDLRLIVVRPLSSRPRYGGRRLFFAHPGYLLCSDPALSVQQAVQSYVWRWEIEVGFREQKTQLGLGQAQMRTRPSARAVLQFVAYTYALLLLAAHHADVQTLPRPKWQRSCEHPQRITFGQILSLLRCDLWGHALGCLNKRDFGTDPPREAKSPKIQNALKSAVLYAMN